LIILAIYMRLPWITLRQQRKISLDDAVIAATVLYFGVTVLTRNVEDFGNKCIQSSQIKFVTCAKLGYG